MKTHVVIMAGGVGSRLYPLSTPEHPKQFCDLLECGKSMIRLTWERFLRVDPEAEFWVVTSAQYGHFVREQLPSVPEDHILLEPAARNTAPCIAYASAKIAASCPSASAPSCHSANAPSLCHSDQAKRAEESPSANIVVTPADAYVPDADAFAATLREALAFTASRDALVCVGIAPTRPETGYGYIHAPAASLCHSERSEGIFTSCTRRPLSRSERRRCSSRGRSRSLRRRRDRGRFPCRCCRRRRLCPGNRGA